MSEYVIIHINHDTQNILWAQIQHIYKPKDVVFIQHDPSQEDLLKAGLRLADGNVYYAIMPLILEYPSKESLHTDFTFRRQYYPVFAI